MGAGRGGTPGINTQRMKTEVLVPDGGTTVVGGVLTDLEVNTKSKTPGLGDVPIIKYLFRTKTTQRNTSEILFFITPRIYRPDYEGNPTSGKIGDDQSFDDDNSACAARQSGFEFDAESESDTAAAAVSDRCADGKQSS